MSKFWNVAVVGPTGVVGGQIIECLEERNFPVGKFRCLGKGSDVGEVLEFSGKPVMVEELSRNSFEGIDIAIFSTGADLAMEFCPAAAAAGAVCIDGSGAWRMDPDVPLVVPEVNPQAIAGYRRKGIIANPGASTIQTVLPLKPLHDFAGIRRVVVSTYQSVSGSGSSAIEELQRQVISLVQGKSPDVEVFPHQIAFNCLPQVDSFCDNGYTREEVEMVKETRRIMETDIRMTVTAVRVPVFYGNSESVNIETERKVTAAEAREILSRAPGVAIVDDTSVDSYPMVMDAAGQDLVLVGRIREDESIDRGLNLWIVADNVRKGAATNAVQIAEILIEKYLR